MVTEPSPCPICGSEDIVTTLLDEFPNYVLQDLEKSDAVHALLKTIGAAVTDKDVAAMDAEMRNYVKVCNDIGYESSENSESADESSSPCENTLPTLQDFLMHCVNQTDTPFAQPQQMSGLLSQLLLAQIPDEMHDVTQLAQSMQLQEICENPDVAPTEDRDENKENENAPENVDETQNTDLQQENEEKKEDKNEAKNENEKEEKNEIPPRPPTPMVEKKTSSV